MWNVCPQVVTPTNDDASLRLSRLALEGYSQLASDTILRRENQGKVLPIIEDSIVQLDQSYREGGVTDRRRSVEVMFEIALNFLGIERKRVGFSNDETSAVLSVITETLEKWERLDEGESARFVIEKILAAMKMVLGGKGMVAKMAEEIESLLVKGSLAISFVESSRKVLQDNVYYRIVDDGLSKFGNDSATGLRWARHLGAVQVSSNPVIAARAFDEIVDLWNRFETVAATHPEWQRDPQKFADEIALYGTVTSLLPNILDFRPIALLSDFEDGMVSIQLNPQKASSVEGSVKDALAYYSILREILENYDAHLVPNSILAENKTRPNIVFKVSTSGPGAISLTENLDKMGIGTNNTVTFTVAQEVRVTLAAIKGLASALKARIPITTIYITNMEGRLEDHLREARAAELLHARLERAKNLGEEISSFSQRTGAFDDLKKTGSLDQQITVLCSKKYLKTLVDDWFVDAIGSDRKNDLKQMEEDIRMSGIYVTRRVFQIMFKPEVLPKLTNYIQDEFGLSSAEAAQVVGAVNLLPASKRRAEDTYLVLADRAVTNLTNTEFPDHQLKVLQKSRESGFALSDFEDSIFEEPDKEILIRLLEIPDFKRAYELNSDICEELNRIGIEVPIENHGLTPEEWSSFGPTTKTLEEFTNAYTAFRSRLQNSLPKLSASREEQIRAKARAK